MEKNNLHNINETETKGENKKLKKSKILNAALIGFFAGILIFGVVSWILSPNKQWGFLIPMLIPIAFIYKLVKKSKK